MARYGDDPSLPGCGMLLDELLNAGIVDIVWDYWEGYLSRR